MRSFVEGVLGDVPVEVQGEEELRWSSSGAVGYPPLHVDIYSNSDLSRYRRNNVVPPSLCLVGECSLVLHLVYPIPRYDFREASVFPLKSNGENQYPREYTASNV